MASSTSDTTTESMATTESSSEGGPRPTIVILDGYTTNPGDLSWDGLARLGDLTVYERTAPNEVAERVADADVIVSNKVVWTADLLREAKRCRMIELLSTGYNVVDLDVANELGITVCNVPAYSTPDVAQHAFALILETTNHVNDYSESVRLGNWVTSRDFTYYIDPLMELRGKTLGIIGMGSIGTLVSDIAAAFGMEVLFENPSEKPELENEHRKQVDLDRLLADSDIVSLHCPSTPETDGMVDAGFLARMRPGARLVNTARGALIDSQAIADALESGHLGWYAADVAEEEPMGKDDPLRTANHSIITPHIAWATKEARERLVAQATRNVSCFLSGRPTNVVPPSKPSA